MTRTVAEFTRTAGSPVHQSTEDPAMQLVGHDVVPDWVRLPDDLGGGRRDVVDHREVACPCGGGHRVREMDLGECLHVAECPGRGFLWYRRSGGQGT